MIEFSSNTKVQVKEYKFWIFGLRVVRLFAPGSTEDHITYYMFEFPLDFCIGFKFPATIVNRLNR
jgi:hypothetical protein